VKEAESDFKKMTDEIKHQVNNVNGQKHDELLNPQTLLGLFTSEGEESGINTKLIAELAENFLATLEKQFNKGSEEEVKENKNH